MLSKSRKYIFILILFLLAACGPSRSQAAGSVEGYLTTLVEKKTDELPIRACAAWEEQALLELSSFGNVGTALENMQCQEAGSASGYTLVQCQGKIMADYNGEQQEFDLSRRVFRTIREGGEWRMCGYQPTQ